MRLIVFLAVLVVLALPTAVSAQEEPYTTALGIPAEQFLADWSGCISTGDTIACADGISARTVDGTVVEVTKRFDPPVLLSRAGTWLPDTLPSDAQVGPATVDTDPRIITQQFTSEGLKAAVGEDTIVISYSLDPSRRGVTSTTATVRGR